MADNPALNNAGAPTDARLLNITIGNVMDSDDDGGISQRDGNGVWSDCAIINRYEFDPKRFMSGLTSPEGFQGRSVAFFQLASPTLLWIADWTVSKSGDVPAVPSMDPGDPDWVLLKVIPETREVQVAGGDGEAAKWRISGTYVYGHVNPSYDVYSHVIFGKPPTLKTGVQRAVPDDKFRQDMIAVGGTSRLRTR